MCRFFFVCERIAAYGEHAPLHVDQVRGVDLGLGIDRRAREQSGQDAERNFQDTTFILSFHACLPRHY